MDALGLLAVAHHSVLSLLADVDGQHFQGLHQAKRYYRLKLSSKTAKQIEQLDVAYAVARHITSVSTSRLLSCIQHELGSHDVAKRKISGSDADSRAGLDFWEADSSCAVKINDDDDAAEETAAAAKKAAEEQAARVPEEEVAAAKKAAEEEAAMLAEEAAAAAKKSAEEQTARVPEEEAAAAKGNVTAGPSPPSPLPALPPFPLLGGSVAVTEQGSQTDYDCAEKVKFLESKIQCLYEEEEDMKDDEKKDTDEKEKKEVKGADEKDTDAAGRGAHLVRTEEAAADEKAAAAMKAAEEEAASLADEASAAAKKAAEEEAAREAEEEAASRGMSPVGVDEPSDDARKQIASRLSRQWGVPIGDISDQLLDALSAREWR